jgi:capsular exopolysaccharide synthesis family protein
VGALSYFRIMRAYWPILLVGVVIGLSGATVVTLMTPRTYESSVTVMLLTQRQTSSSPLDYEGILLATEKAKSYVQLFTTEEMARQVVDRLELDTDPADLAENIATSLRAETVLINVLVSARSPERAQQVARALSEIFVATVEDLEQPADRTNPPTLTATIVQPPIFSADPISPSPLLNLVLGGFLGLLAGLAGAVAWNALWRPVRSIDETIEATGSSVLGTVVADRNASRRPLALVQSPNGPRAEAFRKIRGHLTAMVEQQRGAVFAIVSPSYGDGRTLTVCNLAVALAQAGRTVALVDCDLRRPRIGAIMGTAAQATDGRTDAPGLSDVLQGQAEVAAALRRWGVAPLDVLAAGPVPPQPGDLLAAGQLSSVLTLLTTRYDVVLIDTPPLTPVGDAIDVARLCDGVIMVVRYGATGLADVRTAANALRSASATMIGSILNGVPRTSAPSLRIPRRAGEPDLSAIPAQQFSGDQRSVAADPLVASEGTDKT